MTVKILILKTTEARKLFYFETLDQIIKRFMPCFKSQNASMCRANINYSTNKSQRGVGQNFPSPVFCTCTHASWFLCIFGKTVCFLLCIFVLW